MVAVKMGRKMNLVSTLAGAAAFVASALAGEVYLPVLDEFTLDGRVGLPYDHFFNRVSVELVPTSQGVVEIRLRNPEGHFAGCTVQYGADGWVQSTAMTEMEGQAFYQGEGTNPGGPNKTWVKDSWRAPDVSSSSGERRCPSNSKNPTSLHC